jgi:homoserine kinase
MIRVRIPATTANLGPGFDCMGLALDLWNTFELYLGGNQIIVESHGEGASILPKDATNLTVATMLAELDKLGLPRPSGFKIIAHNTVPCVSGLGSSSTATLAGVLFAHAMLRDSQGFDPTSVNLDLALRHAIQVEGHGDNVAPALLGGFVVVMPDEEGVITQRVPYVPIKTVVCVPDFAFPTSVARQALPDMYSKADAIFNIGRAMLVSEALRSGDDAILKRAMDDRIHEPYRLPLIPGAKEAKLKALEMEAICVTLSGAGPGIIAFARDGYDRIGRGMKQAFAEVGLNSKYYILDVAARGTQIERLPV